jgi:hypothetical protein
MIKDEKEEKRLTPVIWGLEHLPDSEDQEVIWQRK